MGFCFELDSGCCGCPIRTTVCSALCHFIIHGILIVTFAFTNECYPPYYYVDYMFGGCGAALIGVSVFSMAIVDLKKCQCLRSFTAFLIIVTVLSTIVTTFYYVIERWNDVIVTAFTSAIRPPSLKSFPDELWFVIAVMICLVTPIFLFYMIYILSFMCNPWKSHLFTSDYQNNRDASSLPPPLTIPADNYSTRQYKPYPVQKNATNE